mgnify:CR=1 FL=1
MKSWPHLSSSLPSALDDNESHRIESNRIDDAQAAEDKKVNERLMAKMKEEKERKEREAGDLKKRLQEEERRAAEQEAYPCQTLLLTLQANIILQQLGQGRGDRALSDLDDAVRSCVGL